MGYFTATVDFYDFGESWAGFAQMKTGVTYCREITYNTMRNRERLQDFTSGWSKTRRLVKLDRDVPNETGMDIGCPNEGSPVTKNKDLRRFLPAVRRRAAKAAVGN